MYREAKMHIDREALVHNAKIVKQLAPKASIIAMVKANAYGCGAKVVVDALKDEVDAYGVASIDEALALQVDFKTAKFVLFEGVFSADEYALVAHYDFDCVIHQQAQLDWLLKQPLSKPIGVWVKVNTGMNRLGFKSDEFDAVWTALNACPWVKKPVTIMSHFASADSIDIQTKAQLSAFLALALKGHPYKRSMANSAAILNAPQSHFDAVRPGIMLYGVSPFDSKEGASLDLKPVMSLTSKITAIQTLQAGEHVGYGAAWTSTRPSRIAIVAIGYGDGYPRHISSGTMVWVGAHLVPIVGRVSMDMLTLDITDFPMINLFEEVELWGKNLPIETIAKASNTLAYELLCQVLRRV